MAQDVMSFDISLQGFDEMAKRFKNSPQLVQAAQNKMLDLATMVAWGKAKELAPVDKDTLRRSISRKVENGVGRVGTNISYAKYQELGTGIYAGRGMIVPRNARFLAWKTKAGTMAFAKAVRGVQPKKYLQGGLEEVKNKMQNIKDLGSKIIKDGLELGRLVNF